MANLQLYLQIHISALYSYNIHASLLISYLNPLREMIETILIINAIELLDFHISYENICNRWLLPNQDISCLKE